MMNPVPTVNELIEIVHRYYPAGMQSYDPQDKSSPEIQRLVALLERELESLEQEGSESRWPRFLNRLQIEFPACIKDTDTPNWWHPCYSARVALTDAPDKRGRHDHVVALIGVLAPVYAVYASHASENEGDTESWVKFSSIPARFQEREARLAALIEEEYGFVRLPKDVLSTPVPDRMPTVGLASLEKAHLIDFLFTRHPW